MKCLLCARKISCDKAINTEGLTSHICCAQDREIAELKAQYQERSVKFYKLTAQADVLKEQLKQAESKLSARSTQIADLKHRLEKAESVTSLLCKYGKDTERNKRLSLPHEIFVAIDKALEK